MRLTPNIHLRVVFAQLLKVLSVDDKQPAGNHWRFDGLGRVLLSFGTLLRAQILPFEHLPTGTNYN